MLASLHFRPANRFDVQLLHDIRVAAIRHPRSRTFPNAMRRTGLGAAVFRAWSAQLRMTKSRLLCWTQRSSVGFIDLATPSKGSTSCRRSLAKVSALHLLGLLRAALQSRANTSSFLSLASTQLGSTFAWAMLHAAIQACREQCQCANPMRRQPNASRNSDVPRAGAARRAASRRLASVR